jgi:hypothetical protein
MLDVTVGLLGLGVNPVFAGREDAPARLVH